MYPVTNQKKKIPKGELTVFITLWDVGAVVAAPGLPVGLGPLCLAVGPGLGPGPLAKLAAVQAGRLIWQEQRRSQG